LGSVLGPLYGGLILTVATWQTIFWLNLPLAGLLALALVAAGSLGFVLVGALVGAPTP